MFKTKIIIVCVLCLSTLCLAILETLKTRLCFVNSKCRKPTKFQRVYILLLLFFGKQPESLFFFLTALLNNLLQDLSVFHGQRINNS